MRHRSSALLAMLLAASLALPAFAGPACQIQAYSSDPDPAGANVRSGPGTQFPVIGVLEPEGDGPYAFTPEFTISGFDNGWFKIGDAVTGDYGLSPVRTVFTGPGWLSAKLAGFEIEDPHLYEKPSTDAGLIVDLHDAWSLDNVHITAIHGCIGRYIHVTLTNASGSSATGWATDLCGNQATTCS